MRQDSSNYDELKNLIQEAKRKLGKKSIEIIAKDLNLKNIQAGKSKDICPFHEESSPSLEAYPDEGSFYCFGCNKHYDIIDHYIEFNKLTFIESVKKLFDLTDTKYSFLNLGGKQRRDYVYPKYDKSEDRSKVEKYLSKRKISKNTLDHCDIQQSEKEGHVVFNYYDENDILTSVKYRPARKIRDGDNKCWFQPNADNRMILFNMNRVDPTKPLIISEGELDNLSLVECGITNSVSVPNGAGNTKWIEENFEWLEQFDKIIVWADSDPAGIKMRKEVCSRLGTWRTFYVDIPEELQKYEDSKNNKKFDVKDINEVLYCYGKEKVRELIDNAQEMPIEGISDLATVDDFDIETAEGLTPKIGVLKNVIYKFLLGSVVLVTGYPGAGKSTMVNQLFVCDALQEGRDVFLFSDELSAPVVRSWFEWTLAGPEFVKTKDEFVHVVDPLAQKKMRKWYKEHVWIYNDISNRSEDILNKAIAVTRKYGVKVWVLDNLMSMDLGANGKNIYEAQKNFIVKLNNLAIEYGVLAVLVAHPRKYAKGEDMETQDISGSSDLGNRAQYIIGIRRFKESEQRKGQHNYDQEISILKNRYTGKLGKPKVYFDYDSYRFYGNYQKELYMRYGWDDPNRITNYKKKHIEKHEGPYNAKGKQPF